MVGVADRDRQRVGGIGAGRSRRRAAGGRTIACTCSLSAPPVPTTARFTAFAPYSATGRPASAGASSATPRAWPSFSVARRLRLT